MRWLVNTAAGLVIVVAACGSGTAGDDRTRAEARASRPIPRVIEPVTGAPGGAIDVLAVTGDGRAAVTGDTTGGLRLWPALDGTREPIVISGPIAAELAIAREGTGFAIAVTDAARQVVLIRVDNTGHPRTRSSLGEADQVAALADGFLLLRADQMIDHVELDGTLRGRLAAEPGTRVRSLAVRDAAAVAIVDAERRTTARTIELATLAWGKHSAALSITADAALAGLTADHEALLALGASAQVRRFDLATGTAQAACPDARSLNRGDFDEFDLVEPAVRIAAVQIDGGKIACLVDGTVSWFDIATGGTTTVNVGETPTDLVMAGGGDRVVIANDHQLVIATPERTDFLGYGVRQLSHVRAVPTGVLIGKGDQEPILLDDDFKERARFQLPKPPGWWTDLIPLDDRFVLASLSRSSGGDAWGTAYELGVYDIVKQAMHQVLPFQARSAELAYEPATRLLATSDGGDLLLVRMNPTTHTLGTPIVLAVPAVTKRVALTDPQLAGGLAALAIEDVADGGLVVRELHAADLPPPKEVDGKRGVLSPRRSYRISGELIAVDRAGRVFVRDARDADVIGVYAGGERRAELPATRAARLRPSPDGKHVAVIEDARVSLFAIERLLPGAAPTRSEAHRLWETAAWGATDLDWTPRGILYARFPGGLARIEVATGALVERQCGWAFGISAMATAAGEAAPSVCDVR